MRTENLMARSVILVDKPQGPTSFDIVELVSGLLSVKKAGHSGTLDPNATGVMLIALGEARKAMPVLTGLDKEYVGIMKLHGDVETRELKKAMKSFTGVITQLPPVRSAVARKTRKRHVYALEILEIDGRNVKFRVSCEAGTYIRKLAHDIGQSLVCGAHLIELRRTKIGPFSIAECITLTELEKIAKEKDEIKDVLIPLEKALSRIKLPKIIIKNEYEQKIRNGSPVRKNFVKTMSKPLLGNLKQNDYVGIFNEGEIIICLGKFVSSKNTVAKTERVFIL